MLRLAIQSTDPGQTVLEAHGRIAGEEVAFLEGEAEQWLGKAQALALDLSGVRFIDRAGVELLRRWTDQGVALRNGSPFVQALLRGSGSE